MQYFGLSCKVFERTEFRGCVLIGSCHWLRLFILFVAQFKECSNWYLVPLLAVVSTEVNVFILEKVLLQNFKSKNKRQQWSSSFFWTSQDILLSLCVMHLLCLGPGTKEKQQRRSPLNPYSCSFVRCFPECGGQSWLAAAVCELGPCAIWSHPHPELLPARGLIFCIKGRFTSV